MRLDANHKLRILAIAQGHWIRAQSTIYAYERAFNTTKRGSEWLKGGTILAAGITAISAFFPTASVLTTSAATITAFIAIAEKTYLPSDNSKKFWECRTKLEGVKNNLATFVITLEEIPDLTTGVGPLNNAGVQIENIVQQMPVSISDADRNKTSEDYKSCVIATTTYSIKVGTDINEEEDSMIELPEDAPGVIPAYRPPALSQS